MYYLIDKNGCVRGQTSDRKLIEPLKNALEYVMKCKIIVFITDSRCKYLFMGCEHE